MFLDYFFKIYELFNKFKFKRENFYCNENQMSIIYNYKSYIKNKLYPCLYSVYKQSLNQNVTSLSDLSKIII